MIVRSLTYKQPDGENTFAVGKGFTALRCSDAHVSRILSRLLCRMLDTGATHASSLPLSIAAELSGLGIVSALIASEDASASGDTPCISVDAAKIDAPGEDLLLLSVEDIFDVGDEPAHIAQAMAAIVDTGNAKYNLIAAVARLDAFASTIGRGDEDDSPLAQAVAQLEALKTEKAAAKSELGQAALNASMLRRRRDEVAQYRDRRNQTEQRLCASVLRHAMRCQDRLEQLEREIEDVSTRPCVDSEQAAAIQRGETLLETARLQLERTRAELQDVVAELNALQAVPDGSAEPGDPELFDRLQRDIQTASGRITEFNARLDEVNSQITTLDEQVAETQEQMAALPDFSRIAPNPIDWLNQLARSFKTALGARDNEEETRDALRAELADLRVEIAGDAAIFENSVNFAEELMAHQNTKKQWEERSAQITEKIRRDRSRRDELLDKMPGLFLLSLGCGLFLSLLLGAYVGLQKTPILYPGAFFLLSVLYFLAQMFITRKRIVWLTQNIAAGQTELDAMNNDEKGDVSQVDRLMARAGCATARELEARYDHYRELRGRLDALEARCAQHEEHLHESEERIPKLFERVRSTLEQVNEPPGNEDDVEGAVGRAIAKYQVYRETKRRLADLRNQHQGLLGRKRFLEKELTTTREGLPETERRLRELMRDQGFAEESDYRDVNNALTAYYRFLDTNEQTAGRRNALTRTQQSLEARLPEEASLLEQHRHSLGALLARAGFTAPEQARAAMANTLALRDLEREKQDVEQQCEALLQGRALESWRKLAGDMIVGEDDHGREFHARELEAAEQQLEGAMQQYRALRQERRQALASHRPPYEIEEDMATLEKHIETLRCDITAAAHAIALIEESLCAWRAQYGEAVAGRASEILNMLGAPALILLEFDSNAAPTLVVMDEGGHAAPPPATLYLALRLAAAELLTDANESQPLIIDATLQGAPLPVPPGKFLDALGECALCRQVLLVFESDEIAAAVAARQTPMLVF